MTNNTRYKDKYIATYEHMRNSEEGTSNYSVDDMDVTLITELVVARFVGIESVEKVTRNALIELRDNRNLTNHSSENEEADELYLRGLLALSNLRDFVRIVDKFETAIDDNKRLAYRQKYIPKIEELKDLLDEERIDLVQKEKSMRKDIQRVLDSDDPLKTWVEVSELYMNRYYKLEKNYEGVNEFMVRASDAGVVFAHLHAAQYFMIYEKDYKEAESRLFMLYDSGAGFTVSYAHEMLEIINDYILKGNHITEGMQKIIKGLEEHGFKSEKNEIGLYVLVKN